MRMTEEMQIVFEKLSFCFETRKFADLRIILLDMEPADIALFMRYSCVSELEKQKSPRGGLIEVVHSILSFWADKQGSSSVGRCR